MSEDNKPDAFCRKDLAVPRVNTIQSIHQIELTSRCNLRCKYCVHPHMKREKRDMDAETYQRALHWVRKFVAAGTQGPELNLCGIGESTMHPDFCNMVAQARTSLGWGRQLIMATNGVGVTEEHAEAMADAEMRVWVSLHRPEKGGPTVNLLRKHGVLAGISTDPSMAAVDWAGQVNWEVTAPKGSPCPWLARRQAFVGYNGDVLKCCFDGDGVSKLGTVWDEVDQLVTGPYSLCDKCHHTVL